MPRAGKEIYERRLQKTLFEACRIIMKIVIFAGGVGSRLWPLSRKNSPKQFGKLVGDQSTLQLTVERLLPEFGASDIFIATGQQYKEIVREQLPQIPEENFIFEPMMRDVGPALGLVSCLLAKKFGDEPIAILWSDHIVKNVNAFRDILRTAEDKVKNHNANFVFISQKPRFANQNMGWIEVGEKVEDLTEGTLYKFQQLRYRPSLDEAKQFFHDHRFVWNLGYFVTTPKYLASLFASHTPEMHAALTNVADVWGTGSYEETLANVYPTLEKISFDDAILVKLKPDNMYVISADLGWSDIGAWESLKEALANHADENVTKGDVLAKDSRDSLLFNFTDQLVVGIDLEEMIVINTEDVVLICPKESVPKIKKFVESLGGTEHEHLA
jgi:mannose-1-phosphate guanylyltransferase